MKKCIVLLLALLLVCTTAYAAGWTQGLGPEKPYTGTPKVDLTENIGYMMLHPISGSTVTPGLDTLRIFMPREDVLTGTGTLQLYTDGVKEPVEIEITEQTMIARPMTEVELNALLWGCGTVFEIALPQPLEANFSFNVRMTEGCIIAMDFDTPSPAFDKSDIWSFNTMTDNIVENLTYYRVEEPEETAQPGQEAQEAKETAIPAETVQVGDMARISIVMAEDAAAAAVYCKSGAILPVQYSFTESSETDVFFPEAGEAQWGVIFMDAEGKLLHDVSFTTIVAPAE